MRLGCCDRSCRRWQGIKKSSARVVTNVKKKTAAHREEERPLVLKVEHRRVAHEHGKGAAHQQWVVPDHSIENLAVRRRKVNELGRRGVGELVDDEQGLDQWKQDSREVEEIRLGLDAAERVSETLPEVGNGERAVDRLDLLLVRRQQLRGPPAVFAGGVPNKSIVVTMRSSFAWLDEAGVNRSSRRGTISCEAELELVENGLAGARKIGKVLNEREGRGKAA